MLWCEELNAEELTIKLVLWLGFLINAHFDGVVVELTVSGQQVEM